MRNFILFQRGTGHTGRFYYREYYEEKGMFENEVYPGIKELLRVLTKQGDSLSRCHLKPEIYAKKKFSIIIN